MDNAKEKFQVFIDKVKEPKYWNSIKTEADVRMKIIDPMFVEILGWPIEDVHLESSAGKKFIDYSLTIKTFNRLIVEAKKEARDLGINQDHSNRYFKVNGAALDTEAAKEGISQAIYYCGHKSAELACVTNGRQWAIFRGARGDMTNTLDGQACVFGSLDGVYKDFRAFYELLAYENVEHFSYRAIFRQAEGQPIRQKSTKSIARSPDSRLLMPADKLVTDLDRVMQSFFRDLSGEDDVEARRACFVTTSESTAAEKGLERISEELRDKVQSISTAETGELTELIKRVKEMQKHELVLLVGTKGAGKTTFIDRFFADILPEAIRKECVIVRIDMSKSGRSAADITKWLDEHFLEAAEKAAFPNGPPSYDEIQGMFFTEYKRWSEGNRKHLYENDKIQFKIEFGKHIEDLRRDRPHQYITHMLFRIVQAHGKIPCLVFDNADHFDVPFQEAVFNYAHSLCTEALCLVILPITDTTSWQLAKQGPMQSFFTDSFFLPTPPTDLVLRKRIEYIEKRLAEEQAESGKKPEGGKGYFFSRGMRMDIEDIKHFAACLQTVFVNTGQVADWIGRLANHDIRRCLQFTREIIASPHVKAHELLAAYTVKTSMTVNPDDVKMAMIRGKYDIYNHTVHSFVQNLYTFVPEFETTPLLPVRILQFLEAAWYSNRDNDGRYVLVTEIVAYFQEMNIDSRATLTCLDAMLKRGLCLSYDPTADGIHGTVKVEIAPSGQQHLAWALRDWVYIESMAEVTPMYDSESCERIRAFLKDGAAHLRRSAIATFVDYLLQEDKHFCMIPKHEIYKPQETIRTVLGQQSGQISSQSRITLSGRYHRLFGRVTGWRRDKAFGFIKQNSGGDDAFLNIAEILNKDGDVVADGANVEYETVKNEKGLRAVNVVLLD